MWFGGLCAKWGTRKISGSIQPMSRNAGDMTPTPGGTLSPHIAKAKDVSQFEKKKRSTSIVTPAFFIYWSS